MNARTIRIEGMHCGGCASRLMGLLEMEPGVREADVSYADGEARVKFNEHSVGADRLRQIIEGAGYTASETA